MSASQREALLQDWKDRCDRVQAGHYAVAAELQRWHSWFGVPVVILSAIVGSSILASLDSATTSTWLKVVTGFLSMCAAGLSAAQTFLRFGERSERHRQAGVSYSALKREIEQIITYDDDSAIRECIDDIRKHWDALNADCPTIPLKHLRESSSVD